MKLSVKLDAYRREHHLSQKQLAQRMKCSPAFVSQLLSGVRKSTSIEHAKEYSARLDGSISINDFIGLPDYHSNKKTKLNNITFFSRLSKYFRRDHA